MHACSEESNADFESPKTGAYRIQSTFMYFVKKGSMDPFEEEEKPRS